MDDTTTRSETKGEASAEAQARAKLPRILVVDDMPDNLFLMNGLLEDRFQVIQAASGREALEVIMGPNPPDMVLLDIMMPDMDGYEVLRRMRQHTPTETIPVIFLTALASQQDARLGMNLGAVDYLTKPVDPDLVMRRIDGHVRHTAHARRIEALSEKLSRKLAPGDWQRLFRGPDVEGIRFEQKRQTILYAEIVSTGYIAPVQHDTFVAEVDWLGTRHGGVVDRFQDGAALVSFDDPAACVRTAMELHRSTADMHVRMGVITLAVDIATFRSDFLESHTLIGPETRLAARVAACAASGSIAISPETYEAVRVELDSELAGCMVMEEYDASEDLALICVTPPPVRSEHVMSSFAGLGLLAH